MTVTPPEAPANSILAETKKALGLAPEYAPFDADILMHINSVFADLHQLGVGPTDGFSIVNAQDTWDELIGTDKRLNNVKSYVFLRVKMLFDTPTTGYVLTAREKIPGSGRVSSAQLRPPSRVRRAPPSRRPTNTVSASAGSILAALPSVAMFFAMQKHFVAGLTFGATKG